MRTLAILAAAAALLAVPALAQQKPKHDFTRADTAVKDAFKTAPAEWQPRLDQDETMKACSAYDNHPPAAIADEIRAREKARIEYPADGKLMGDWKLGERLAQSGYGMRFTDYPATAPNGGNCYACHQITKQEVSYGTIGPTLAEYGKIRQYSEADVRTVYEKIYNGHAVFPCSTMPRFGTNKILTQDQIKDLVALLMDPQSPVNK